MELRVSDMSAFYSGPQVETLPPPGGNLRPILDRSISYPNPKLTCYVKIQCRLQELWPLKGHSVNKEIFWGIFFLVIGIEYYLQNHFQSFWVVKLFTFMFYEYSISSIYRSYIRKKQTSAAVFSKGNEYMYYLSAV